LDIEIIVDWNTYKKELSEQLINSLSKNEFLEIIFLKITEAKKFKRKININHIHSRK